MKVGEVYVNKPLGLKDIYKSFVTLKKYMNNDMWIVSVAVYKDGDCVSRADDFPMSGASIYKFFTKYTGVK